MKNTKKILYIAVASIIIAAICAVCFIVGRGHTIYLDNKTLEEQGLKAFEKVVVEQNGEEVASLQSRERGVCTVMGQTVKLHLIVTKTKNAAKEEYDVEFEVPYSTNEIVLSLPAYVNGCDSSVYLAKFVPAIQETTEDEEVTTDEFGMASEG